MKKKYKREGRKTKRRLRRKDGNKKGEGEKWCNEKRKKEERIRQVFMREEKENREVMWVSWEFRQERRERLESINYFINLNQKTSVTHSFEC